MIAFSCTRCGMKFRVQPAFAGRPTRCPACKQPLVVPKPDGTLAFPAGEIDGTASSVDRAGVPGGVSLDTARPGGGQKSVAELLAGRRRKSERYLVEGEIARGGMGAILRAVDCDIRREVAVKYLLDQADASKKARFVEEAQITGQLEHPNIVPIHELGIDSRKRLFFAMKMVRGRSLAQVVEALRKDPAAEKEYTLSRLVNVFLNVCNPLAYAHARRVIHRDLKPANVMLGDFGEVYVMDWGLAKVKGQEPEVKGQGPGINDQTSRPPNGSAAALASVRTSSGREPEADLTQEGAVVGTPYYMPPEQAAGRIGAIDERSDVYSLGAILYELLTLLPPVETEGGTYAVLLRAAAGEVIPLEQRAPARARAGKIPRELSAIAMKALAKAPADRYPTVEALRKDVERYQEGRSVSAKDDTRWEVLWKFVKRNRGLSAGLATTLVVLTSSLCFIGYAYLALGKASANYRQEQEEKQRRTKEAVPAFVEAARLAADRRRFGNALEQLDVALAYAPNNAAAHLLKGRILIAQGEFSRGKSELERYARLEPTDNDAARLIEWCSRPRPEDVGNLLAIAQTFVESNQLTLADHLLRNHGGNSLDVREKLLKVYQAQLNAAWKGVGARLSQDEHGIYKLYMRDAKEVTHLGPLEGLPITALDLAGCGQVRDLTPLRGMALTTLHLGGCAQVRDLSPLRRMPLTWLNLGSCGRVEDLSPLEGMSLASLQLVGCGQVRDLSPLKGMPLRRLELDDCRLIQELGPLHGMPLTWLSLVDCVQVRDLSPLRGMPLTFLNLWGCEQARDLTPLQDLRLSEIILPPEVARGTSGLRRLKSLGKINQMPADVFWKEYDAGKLQQYKP